MIASKVWFFSFQWKLSISISRFPKKVPLSTYLQLGLSLFTFLCPSSSTNFFWIKLLKKRFFFSENRRGVHFWSIQFFRFFCSKTRWCADLMDGELCFERFSFWKFFFRFVLKANLSNFNFAVTRLQKKTNQRTNKQTNKRTILTNEQMYDTNERTNERTNVQY
jgi:hypothetical protein